MFSWFAIECNFKQSVYSRMNVALNRFDGRKVDKLGKIWEKNCHSRLDCNNHKYLVCGKRGFCSRLDCHPTTIANT